MVVIDFKPGDGTALLVLFGRTRGATSALNYTVFGFRDDARQPLTAFPFDHDDIDFATFTQALMTAGTKATTLQAAWRVYCALVGLPDAPLPDGCPAWQPDWRNHLQPGTW